MSDAAPGDTSSTPTTAAAASVTAPATDTTQPVAVSTETTPVPAPSTPAATDSPPATTATTADTAPKTETKAPAPEVAFTVPDDLKLAPEAIDKFKSFVSGKTPNAEGKITLTPQEIVDVFAEQSRGAYSRWQSQMTAQDKAWEAESKARFSAPQLKAAETGIGFLTSFEPSFRELAKGYRNNPSFVNAMRIVGERLSEDTFEVAGTPPAVKRAAKDIMYPKPN